MKFETPFLESIFTKSSYIEYFLTNERTKWKKNDYSVTHKCIILVFLVNNKIIDQRNVLVDHLSVTL